VVGRAAMRKSCAIVRQGHAFAFVDAPTYVFVRWVIAVLCAAKVPMVAMVASISPFMGALLT
jgi:hypothetical protein